MKHRLVLPVAALVCALLVIASLAASQSLTGSKLTRRYGSSTRQAALWVSHAFP